MNLTLYLTLGIVVFWLASTLAAFVNKKTNNGLLTAIAWLGSAYLLLELMLTLVKNLHL